MELYICDKFTRGKSCVSCGFGILHKHGKPTESYTSYWCMTYKISCRCVQTTKLEYEMKRIIAKGSQK